MKRASLILATLLMVTREADAQLGDILNKIDKNRDKIKQGTKIAVAATKDFTEEEEIAIGRVVAARILATYPLSGKEKLQKYVTLVGNTVALYSSRPNLSWHFAVIETPLVNAFSAPGGYLFITTGALDQIASEAELAAVLGHEIAHATEKHILTEIRRANVVAAGMEVVGDRYGSGGLTEEVAIQIGNIAQKKLFETGIGRREELDADRIGLQMAMAAGYRGQAVITFLQRLQALAGGNPSAIRQLTATHPRPDERAKALSAIAVSDGALLADRWERWRSQ